MSDSKWVDYFCIAVLVLSIVLFVTWLEKTSIQKQAIERGHAEYVVDSNGKTTWQWKEKKQ